jgi:hypothetical protein
MQRFNVRTAASPASTGARLVFVRELASVLPTSALGFVYAGHLLSATVQDEPLHPQENRESNDEGGEPPEEEER